jgi:hypothetical protein
MNTMVCNCCGDVLLESESREKLVASAQRQDFEIVNESKSWAGELPSNIVLVSKCWGC